MKTVSFELTMPNRGSWNGQWSGQAKRYYIVRKVKDTTFNEKLAPIDGNTARNFYYSFGDGWGANVAARFVDAKTARQHRKISAGFCGYDWMVDSIIWHGDIRIL